MTITDFRRLDRSTVLAHSANSFDGLRLLAAFAVVVGHAVVLTHSGRAPRIGGIPLHTLGVAVFFSISGYLIAGSWQRNPQLLGFLRNRCLRIFPALVVTVLVTVGIVGPALSTLPPSRYFSSAETYRYLTGLVLTPQYELPGVFQGPAHASPAVNGSLWTLGVEFCCYLLVAAVGLCRLRRPWLVFGILGLAAGVIAMSTPSTLLGGALPDLQMVVYFLAGAVLAHVQWHGRTAALVAALVLGGAWVLASLLAPPVAPVCAWLAVPVLTVYIGRLHTPGIRSAAKFGDLSYGTYLWAYLVQQIVIDVSGSRPPLIVDITLTLAMALMIATFSWHLVERRALTRKATFVAAESFQCTGVESATRSRQAVR